MTLAYLARRTITAAITLALASLGVFAALLVLPGDPVQLILGLREDPELHAQLSRQLGLDKPPAERYLAWVAGAARGDLGQSITYRQPVAALIGERLPVTLPLLLGSSLLALLVALPAGALAASHRGSRVDSAVVAASQGGLAIPSFWLGLLLVLLFAVRLQWLPATGFTPWSEDPARAARSLVLPVLTLGLGQAATLVRAVRAGILDVLGQDYVRTARSKGVGGFGLIRRHVLRNALASVLTLLGVQVGQLLAGAVIIEAVFALPGLGTLALAAVQQSDFPLVQGVVLLIALAIVGLNLLVDLAYGWLDPRVSYD
ncbi:MAG TPA: ABC transporter permease [Deinococcales bacterium]|nr:ABC transporter permease [Deinococcales bacterium]